jgi:hypothetical protein
MLKSKLSAFFSLVLVFLSGAMVGGIADRLYNAPPAAGQRTPDEVRRAIIADMRKEVKVDDQQVEQLNRIYDDTQQQFMQIRKKQNAEARSIWDNQTAQIRAILRPDQVALFDAMHAKHEAERKKKQQEHHKGPPPDTRK